MLRAALAFAATLAAGDTAADDGSIAIDIRSPRPRAVVEDGVAVMALFNEPIAGAPLSLSASKDNAVSVPLQVEGRIFSIRGSGGSRLEKATPRT